MRSIKELLQVMLDNKELFYYGLCHLTSELYYKGLINEYEKSILLNYINKNRPSKFSSLDAYINRNYNYYWKGGNINPRIKWIKKHIKLNS